MNNATYEIEFDLLQPQINERAKEIFLTQDDVSELSFDESMSAIKEQNTDRIIEDISRYKAQLLNKNYEM